MLEIPKLDLSHFINGTLQHRAEFVHDLGLAYEEIGFVAIRNHGIDQNLLDEMYRQVQLFFDLPYEIKQQYNDDEGGGQRGYTSFGREHAKNRQQGDLKEFWHFGQFVEDDDPVKDFYQPNKFVKELPEFSETGKKIYKALEDCGEHILRAISIYLGIEETYFDAKIHNGNSILRPIYYPPITSEPSGAIRAGEHEDINLITILVGASADGLEVLDKSNNWIAVTEVEDHVVVNVGDMLQRLTNDKLQSTMHRVVNPPMADWGKPRYSIPFFLHPRPEMSLACLTECVSESHPKKYNDITAHEFLLERLREIGLVKGS